MPRVYVYTQPVLDVRPFNRMNPARRSGHSGPIYLEAEMFANDLGTVFDRMQNQRLDKATSIVLCNKTLADVDGAKCNYQCG